MILPNHTLSFAACCFFLCGPLLLAAVQGKGTEREARVRNAWSKLRSLVPFRENRLKIASRSISGAAKKTIRRTVVQCSGVRPAERRSPRPVSGRPPGPKDSGHNQTEKTGKRTPVRRGIIKTVLHPITGKRHGDGSAKGGGRKSKGGSNRG